MNQATNSKDIPKCLTKAEVYEHIRFQLLEMKERKSVISIKEQDSQSDRIAVLINNLEELDKTFNGEKSQYLEKEILLKSDIEQLKTKLQLKEMKNQELNEQLNDLHLTLQEQTKLIKSRLNEIANRVIECFKENESMESIRNKLEIVVYRLNCFIKNGIEMTSKEEKLFECYQKEFCELSLSQREKAAFNYIHQPTEQEDLKDICLNDLLQIPSQANPRIIKRKIPLDESKEEEERRERYQKFLRIFNCKSEIVSSANSEFNTSEGSIEESLDEDDILDKSSKMKEQNMRKENGIQCKIEDNKNANNTIVEVTEAVTTLKSQVSANGAKRAQHNGTKKKKSNPTEALIDDELKKALSLDKAYENNNEQKKVEVIIERNIQIKPFQANVHREMIKKKIKDMKKKQLALLGHQKNWKSNNSFAQSPSIKIKDPTRNIDIHPSYLVKNNVQKSKIYSKVGTKSQSKLVRKYLPNAMSKISPSLFITKNSDEHCETLTNPITRKRPDTKAVKKQMETIMAYRGITLNGSGSSINKINNNNYSVKSISRGKFTSSQPGITVNEQKNSFSKKQNPIQKLKERRQIIINCPYRSLPSVSPAIKFQLKNNPSNDYGIKVITRDSQSSKNSRNTWTNYKSGF